MAEQISNHCWATPKCGITTAEIHFRDIKKEIKFEFVIVRNPYRRAVGFYLSKVINYGFKFGTKGVIPHLPGKIDLDCTFEQMVSTLKLPGDRHVNLQRALVGDRKLHFVRLENWTEDMKLVCERLDIDHSKYGYVWENRSTVTDTITEYVGNKPASWFRERGTPYEAPSDYNLFYNDNTKKLIRTLYKEDFEWLADVYDDLEII
jgi:hypothetical protein